MLLRVLAILLVLTFSIPQYTSAQSGAEEPAPVAKIAGPVLVIGFLCVITWMIINAAVAETDPKYIDLKKEVQENEKEGEGDVIKQTENLSVLGDDFNNEAPELEKENKAIKAEIEKANNEAEFLEKLIAEDSRFIKPYRMAEYNNNLIKLNKKNPRVVAKIHYAIIDPPNEYARYYTLQAYCSGQQGGDLWERTKRQEQGLEGGRVKVAGESEPRFVSGGENLYDIVMYIRNMYGDLYKLALMEYWGCSAADVDEVIDTVFLEIE